LSTRITVSPQVDVIGVELIDSGAFAVGQSAQLVAVVSPANATNQNLVFTAEDSGAGTVSETGFLTAIAEGFITVSVTTEEGSYVDTILIPVLNPQPTITTGVPDGPNVESNLVDGSTGTRWSVQDFPQSATVDLEGNIAISQIEVTCYEDRAYQYIIEGALEEDGPFTTIADRTFNTLQGTSATPIINALDGVEARFVRITVLGAAVYMGTWASITELRVFGEGERTFESTFPPYPSGIDDLILENVSIHPNPATSIVTILGAEEFNIVSVYDQTGKRVIHRKVEALTTLDLSELQPGLFMVKLEGNGKIGISKLIKH